jgi:Zn-dependent protease with chaperone function
MKAQWTPWLLLLIGTVYTLGFGTGSALVNILGRSWRRTVEIHWTERARLAFAPGLAVQMLAVYLPLVLALIGNSWIEFLVPRPHGTMSGFWPALLAALAGVLTARYRWLRDLWGPRVTLRSWVGGILVSALALNGHLYITLLVLLLMPDTPSPTAAVIWAAGALAILYLALGGSISTLRFLGVASPASASLVARVAQLAQQMKVPGVVKILELEWAQANALAWFRSRTIGFSRPLLAAMTDDEVQAVAAHELAHLLEPPSVRRVRLLQMFAYLPLLPLIKYTGTGGALLGVALALTIIIGYKNFTRRMEVKADAVERETIGEGNSFMRSMVNSPLKKSEACRFRQKGRMARRDDREYPQRSVREEQQRQTAFFTKTVPVIHSPHLG